MFNQITQEQVLQEKLQVMDQTAASICRENKINILVFNMNTHGNMKKAVLQEPIGTIVKWEE
jgi:uridylate kinase